MNRVYALSLILTAVASSIAGESWPQFRGPTGLGYSDEINLPLKWGGAAAENILWKSPLPKSDNPYSSPIVWRDRVFVTSVRNTPLEHHVLCFQVSDGKPLWDVTVAPGPWKLTDLRGGYGAPTPCTDGKIVFVLFGSAVIVALDFEGKLIWRKDLPRYDFDVAIGTSPILHQDTVIVNCDQLGSKSCIIGFDKKTGEVKWEALRPDTGFAHSTPVIVSVQDKLQMLVSASGALQGLDPASGKILWRCAAQGDASSPAFGSGLVYNDSGRGGPGVCVDPTGIGDVTNTHLKWKIAQIPEGLSSPLIIGEFVYRLYNPEILRCLRLASGEQVYTERLAGVSTWASPIATADGLLYLASAGRSYVVRAGPKLEVIGESNLGEENRASAAIANGRIFLRGDKNLYCIGKK